MEENGKNFVRIYKRNIYYIVSYIHGQIFNK